MGVPVETAEEKEQIQSATQTIKPTKPRGAKTATKPSGLSVKLERLNELGLDDKDKNLKSLRKHKYNLDKCVSDLLNQKDAGKY